jgi:hypothetical protein
MSSSQSDSEGTARHKRGQEATAAESAEPFRFVDVAEQKRLNDAREAGIPWKKWGPYLSERQWGTVREDYSQDGNAWDYFSHDQSRSRAYRWGEDGLGGISDDGQRPHLRRGPAEVPDASMGEFYAGLLACLGDPPFRDGQWQLLDARPAWEGNGSNDAFVLFSWTGPGDHRRLVVANYAGHQSQCYVMLPWGRPRQADLAVLRPVGWDGLRPGRPGPLYPRALSRHAAMGNPCV